ncbi:MAG: polysaccharide deacetylase family protein [Myxococcota bacterium]
MTAPSTHMVSLTFDNFGEAFDLQNRDGSENQTFGAHPSASVLPEILDHLDATELKATFFVEGWNAEHYGPSLMDMARRGHEVSLHGWRHEDWANQTEAGRHLILEDCVEAFGTLGLTPSGLRPPGGVSTSDTAALLAEFDLSYVSPLGHTVDVTTNQVSLPFQWTHVDALYFEPLLAKGRARLLGRSVLAEISAWDAALESLLYARANAATYRTVVFHPYLLAEKRRMHTFKTFTQRLAEWTQGSCVPCRVAADHARSNPDWVAELRRTPPAMGSDELLTAF